MQREMDPHYKFEHVVEALYTCNGFILASLRYIKEKYGYQMGKNVLARIIREENLEEWLDDLRKSLVENTLSKVFKKAIDENDSACLFWILSKYKQHVEFLEAAEENKPESAPGEIVEFMKSLKTYDDNTSSKQNAAPCISTEQCAP